MSQEIFLISDFNVSVLARYLSAKGPKGEYHVREAPYAQAFGTLAETPGSPGKGNVGVIWVRPESISSTFQKALRLEPVATGDCLAEVDFFAEAVLRFALTRKHCFVATFTLPADHPGYGILDWRPELGLTHLLHRLNLRLAERCAASDNIFLLDSARWMNCVGQPSLPKLWYAAKLPHSNSVYENAASDILAGLGAVSGRSRRVILLDLDNTLWGGIVGDVGWNELRIGGHDHVGEAFKDFQESLKALTRRGVQLAILSKNEESVALEAIDSHPEMILRRSDFAGWRINWRDKATNVVDLLEELRLGGASAVFIDDNPVERDRLRSALPDLLVPEWPSDPCLFVQALNRLRCFDTPTVSEEDRARSRMYASEKARREVQTGTIEDWLEQLGTRVGVEPVTPTNIARVDQIFNKTNQLNLATRRHSGAELLEWARGPGRAMFACSVSDKFGDMGLTGLFSVEIEKGEARLVDFLLSCRVMGRKIEETMIHLAVEWSRKRSTKHLVAEFVPTPRNMPTLEVLKNSGLVESVPRRFSWDCSSPYPKPGCISLDPSSVVAG